MGYIVYRTACCLHLQQQMLACADERRPFCTANTLQLQWHHRGSLEGNVVQLISHSLLVLSFSVVLVCTVLIKICMVMAE